MAAIAICTAFGNKSVERVFTWVSILLYGVYAAFVVFALSSFGEPHFANLRRRGRLE